MFGCIQPKPAQSVPAHPQPERICDRKPHYHRQGAGEQHQPLQWEVAVRGPDLFLVSKDQLKTEHKIYLLSALSLKF